MAAAATEPISQRSDERKIARNAALTRLAHEGVMLDGIVKKQAHVLRLAKWAASGSQEGLPQAREDSPEQVDDMGVNIGNETHNHFQIEMKEQPPQPTLTEKAKSGAWKLILSAVAGGGLVALGGLLGQLWNRPQPAPAPPAVDTDTDSTLDLYLPE